MKCPKCDAPGLTLGMTKCHSCGNTFASEDLLEFLQLDFLLKVTASWDVPEAVRSQYLNRLKILRDRLRGPKPAEPEPPTIPSISTVPAAPAVSTPKPVPTPRPVPVHPPSRTPPREKVLFFQWLLSERTIKIALYSGGLLLVLAGLIFIGGNWANISGQAKFAITLMVTGLMYLGGFLLFQRPTLRIGGIALLGVASGFLTLNFVVLQIYVLGPTGLRSDVMWLIASPLCLLLYMLTTYWTKGDLFTYISLAATFSTLTAGLAVINAPFETFVLSYSILIFAIQLLAKTLQGTWLADFTQRPLLIASHVAMPLVIDAAILSAVGAQSIAWVTIMTIGVGVSFYLVSDVFFKWLLARWAASFLFPIAVALGLMQVGTSYMAGGLILMALALAYLRGGYFLEKKEGRKAAGWPLYLIAYAVAFFVTAFAGPRTGSLVIMLFLDVLILTASAAIHRDLNWIYGAAALFPVAATLGLMQVGAHYKLAGFILMVLATAYLGGGYFLEKREGRKAAGWPLYLIAYAVAFFLTVMAVPDTDSLVIILFLDVAILGVSAAIHRNYRWIYGAVWLFMLPYYVTINQSVPSFTRQGLFMGLLGLNYAAAGYALGRKSLKLGGPFLTAAAFLSAIITIMTWSDPIVASIILGVFAVLYTLAALWLGRRWLLLPSFLAVDLAIFTLNIIIFESVVLPQSLVSSYAVLGLILVLGGFHLRRTGRQPWGLPLYVLGAIDLTLAYGAVLFISGPLTLILSAATAALLLALAWHEREEFIKRDLSPLLTYMGIAVVFIAHFYAISISSLNAMDVWPPYTAGLCGLFVALAWLLRREPFDDVYGTPMRNTGLMLMILPTARYVYFTLSVPASILCSVTFVIAGVILAADAALRRVLQLAYLSVGAFLVAIWAMLKVVDVHEPQAYTIPLGIALLSVGWNERRQGRGNVYRTTTLLGLITLMGSAFVQSLSQSNIMYSLLLVFESIVSVGWGIRSRLRGYVQAGALALIANAIVQLGPAFIELSRWIQLGVTGSILFGGGMAALLKREALLATRQKLKEEWRRWEP